jgi:hypothetical protein
MAERKEKMTLIRARTAEQERILLATKEAAVEKDLELPWHLDRDLAPILRYTIGATDAITVLTATD